MITVPITFSNVTKQQVLFGDRKQTSGSTTLIVWQKFNENFIYHSESRTLFIA